MGAIRLGAWPLFVFAVGCGRIRADPDADGDSDVDSDSDSDSGSDTGVEARPGAVDVVLVIDGVSALLDEQDLLAAGLPAFVDSLTSGATHAPATDLHLGVLSADVGANGIPGCTDVGDGGILLHAPNPADPDCSAGYPPWLAWQEGAPAAGEDFACIAVIGEGRCGWEQPFASVSLAVGQNAEPGGPNAGFVREGAVHAVALLDDEDDCSVADEEIWTLGSPLNLRCSQEADRLVSIDSFVEDLFALEPGHAERVVFLGIGGIPAWAVLDDATIATAPIQDAAVFEEILDDPLMVPTLDAYGNALEPVCETARGRGFPSPRVVQTARAIDAAGGAGLVHSICADSYDVALRAMAEEIGRRLDEAG